jgi:nucleoside-diphosphate-sugar epimerase
MNIVVVGANGKMGAHLLPVLRDRGHHVTALVRRDPGNLAASVIVADWPTSQAAAGALRGADSIVNLAGSGNPPRGTSYAQANAEPCERVHALLGETRASHLVFISYPGAPGGRTGYLRGKARGEELSRAAAHRVAILRTSVVCGSRTQPLDSDRAMLVPRGKRATIFGTGQSRCRPVGIDDVAQAIAAVVEQRLDGEFALEGPEAMTLNEIVCTLNSDPGQRIRSVPGWLGLLIGPLMGMRRDFVRFFLADALDVHRNVFTATGLRAHRLADLWPPPT